MHSSRSLVAIICLFSIAFCACNKKPDAIQTISTYTFRNTLSKPVTFDVYNSEVDYNTNSNRAAQYYLQPGDTVALKLQALKQYWVDWYTATYTHNNWQWGDGGLPRGPLPRINVAIEDGHFDIYSRNEDTSRSVLLNGGGLSSTWQCAISNHPGLNGVYTFKFSKSFDCEYTFTPASGNTVLRQLRYYVSNYGGPFAAVVWDEAGAPLATLEFHNGMASYPYNITGRDTLMFGFIINHIAPATYYPTVRR